MLLSKVMTDTPLDTAIVRKAFALMAEASKRLEGGSYLIASIVNMFVDSLDRSSMTWLTDGPTVVATVPTAHMAVAAGTRMHMEKQCTASGPSSTMLAAPVAMENSGEGMQSSCGPSLG